MSNSSICLLRYLCSRGNRYDPEQITTKDGNLVITLDEKPRDNLNYTGGMMSTWNKVSHAEQPDISSPLIKFFPCKCSFALPVV